MTTIPILLADEVTAAVATSWRMSDPAVRERILIFGAIGLVTFLILLWAVFIRKKRRRRHDHYHSQHHASGPAEAGETPAREDVPAPREKRRRRRRSGHKHHPRNPTLAETGGLPPIRTEGPPQPQA
jgi:hypothetical protein